MKTFQRWKELTSKLDELAAIERRSKIRRAKARFSKKRLSNKNKENIQKLQTSGDVQKIRKEVERLEKMLPALGTMA